MSILTTMMDLDRISLEEAYTSHAALNSSDRDMAEKAFKKELTNGPEQRVWYGSQQYKKKVGSFDLEKFHEAYDEYFEANNLLNLFNDDGKLLRRGDYAMIKNLDKTEPAVKYLLQLWGIQFGNSNGMGFTADKLAKQKVEIEAKAKAAEEAANISHYENAVRARLLSDHGQAIQDYAKLAEQINTLRNWQSYKDTTKKYTDFWYISAIPTNGIAYVDYDFHIQLRNAVTDNYDSVVDLRKINVNDPNKPTEDELKHYSDLFKDTLTAATAKTKIEVYLMAIKKKAYDDNHIAEEDRLKFTHYFRRNNKELVEINLEIGKKVHAVVKDVDIDVNENDTFELVCSAYRTSSSSNCYHTAYDSYSYNSEDLSTTEMKELGIPDDHKIYYSKKHAGNGVADISVSHTFPGNNPLQCNYPGYDTWVVSDYECDSSD